jgi:hypothetical protein
MFNKKIKPLNESRGTHVPHSNPQPPPKPHHRDKPKIEMTTYNLLILDKAIQHHYESTEVIRPTQEAVETALRDITIELQDLKQQNAELLITLENIKDRLKSEDRNDAIEALEQRVNRAINIVKRHMR